MSEPTIKDNVKQLMSDLPAPIKTFLVEQLDGIVKVLTAKYNLHVDQGGVLQRDLMLVLLGAREPGALATNLKGEAHLDTPTLTALLNDVNAQIFIPLRAQLENETTSSAPSSPLPNVPIVKPTIRPSTPTMSTPMEDKVLNRLAPQNPGVSSQVSGASKPVAPDTRNPKPETSPQPTPMPKVTAAPPANLPGVVVPKPVLPQVVAPAPVAPPPAPAPKSPGVSSQVLGVSGIPKTQNLTPTISPAPASPTKSYAVDPYREQPEDHEK
jgi:hypothetical protein